MNRVELSVTGVIRIELKRDEPVGKAGIDGELVKQTGLSSASVEIEVLGLLLCCGIENIQGAVQIADEESLRPSGFLAQNIHACERTRIPRTIHRPGYWHGCVIRDSQRDMI